MFDTSLEAARLAARSEWQEFERTRRERQMIKPSKPYPSFPLTAHNNGQWYRAKRIGGRSRFFYFGHWADDPRGERAHQQ